MDAGAEPNRDQLHVFIREHLKSIFKVEDSSGIELFVMLQRAAHLSMLAETQSGDDREVSAPRWGLLLRLLIEEEHGNTGGITPTLLSRSQRVSKNTISALLRGLESQGLIQRTLDADDLRAFRIQLTETGRQYVRNNTARRAEAFNLLLSALDRREREQLAGLLEKLTHSLAVQCGHLPAGSDRP